MQIKATYGIAITAIAAVFSVWLYFTPYIAANNMEKAAKANDSATLSSYIDFPLVKENLKANFNAIIATELAKKKTGDSSDALVAAMATAFISPMVDALVTPENLAMIMQGNKPNLGKSNPSTEKKASGAPDTAPDITMG